MVVEHPNADISYNYHFLQLPAIFEIFEFLGPKLTSSLIFPLWGGVGYKNREKSRIARAARAREKC